MNDTEKPKRDLRFEEHHDAIYAALDLIPNWMVYGHLSFLDEFQGDEHQRLKKFHLLIRDLAKRFTGKRDLDAIGWFLKQEGSWHGKRFHFHFALTSTNLTKTSPSIVCGYLARQWKKIGKSTCEIVPWDSNKTPLGIWYLTQNEESPLHHSSYFHGEYCHWKMSTLLYRNILELADEKETLINLSDGKSKIPRGTFLAGKVLYPDSQLEQVLISQLSKTTLPQPSAIPKQL